MKRPLTKHERTTPAQRSKDEPASSRSEVDEIIARFDREERESGWTTEDFRRAHAEAFAHPETHEAVKRERARLAARRKTVGPRALQGGREPARSA